MKIVVCVKQVPEVTNVQVDPVTGTLVREGVKSILNPFCEYALDHAVRISKMSEDVEIIAISMGPNQAKDVLIRALELGANRGILVTDRQFAGADTWATALTIATAIRKTVPDFDLILVGKQAIDGDTAQVGPEIAEILGISQITYGVEVNLSSNQKKIIVKRELDNGYEVIESPFPTLVTLSKGETVRRAPSFTEVLQALQKQIEFVTANDLNIPENELGLKGSFTQVVKVFPPIEKKSNQVFEGLDAETAALTIYDFLKESKFI